MKDFSAFLDMRSCKNWAPKIFSWKSLTLWRPVLPVFPRAQSASFLVSSLSSFQGMWKSMGAMGVQLKLFNHHSLEAISFNWRQALWRFLLLPRPSLFCSTHDRPINREVLEQGITTLFGIFNCGSSDGYRKDSAVSVPWPEAMNRQLQNNQNKVTFWGMNGIQAIYMHHPSTLTAVHFTIQILFS